MNNLNACVRSYKGGAKGVKLDAPTIMVPSIQHLEHNDDVLSKQEIHELESRTTGIAKVPDVGFNFILLFLRRLKFLNEFFSIQLRSGTIRETQRTGIFFLTGVTLVVAGALVFLLLVVTALFFLR